MGAICSRSKQLLCSFQVEELVEPEMIHKLRGDAPHWAFERCGLLRIAECAGQGLIIEPGSKELLAKLQKRSLRLAHARRYANDDDISIGVDPVER